FLDLVQKGFSVEAQEFFDRFHADYDDAHGADLRRLEGIKSPSHVAENELANVFRRNKFSVRMSEYAFRLLLSLLHDRNYMCLLAILNLYVDVRVHAGAATGADEDADVSGAMVGMPADAVVSLNREPILWGTLEEQEDI